MSATNPQRHGSRVRCGTASGYRTHQKHQERPCDACTLAKKEYDARRMAATSLMVKNRLSAKAQGIALRRLKDAHPHEYHGLYDLAKLEVFGEQS